MELQKESAKKGCSIKWPHALRGGGKEQGRGRKVQKKAGGALRGRWIRTGIANDKVLN